MLNIEKLLIETRFEITLLYGENVE